MERGDAQAWNDLTQLRAVDKNLAAFMRSYVEYGWPGLEMEDLVFLQSCLARVDRGDAAAWDDFVARSEQSLRFARSIETLFYEAGCTLDEIHATDLDFIPQLMQPDATTGDERPIRNRKPNSRIMYIERKAGQLTGEARIGRVTFSKSGKSLYYRGKRYETQDGRGYKTNYVEVESGETYWISGPRRDGQDRLYGERQPIEIDEDAREEYWTVIRKRPECVDRTVV
jgi:hypothetical protein